METEATTVADNQERKEVKEELLEAWPRAMEYAIGEVNSICRWIHANAADEHKLIAEELGFLSVSMLRALRHHMARTEKTTSSTDAPNSSDEPPGGEREEHDSSKSGTSPSEA